MAETPLDDFNPSPPSRPSRALKVLIIGIMFITACLVIHLLYTTSQPQAPTVKIFPTGYHKPDDLFFTFLKEDQPYISQTLKEHFSRNGYLGTDIGTNGKKLNLYAPSYEFLSSDGIERDEERIYTVHLSDNPDTIGKAIELSWDEYKGEKHTFIIGHTSAILVEEGQEVATGDILGLSGGCAGELQLGEASTGCHTHFEHLVSGFPTIYPAHLYNNHGENLIAVKKMKEIGGDSEGKMERGEALAWDDEIYAAVVENWKIVSAIHNKENGRCAANCKTSLSGARGALQFMPNTWMEYGCDGDNDGIADVENLYDAICGAGDYLAALYQNEWKQAQGLDSKWIFWRAAYRYHGGYKYPATHKDGAPSSVKYADDVIADLERMGAF